jgi:hypothetical protein
MVFQIACNSWIWFYEMLETSTGRRVTSGLVAILAERSQTTTQKMFSSGNDLRRLEDNHEEKEGIECLTEILAEGVDDLMRIEQSRVVAGCHFDLRRIRAAHYDVFLTLGDSEDAKGNDFEIAMRAMDRFSR